MSEPFSEKLAFVLKALSMSRARMAADLGLNKSVIGRWATGAVQPSAHNLSLLSAFMAERLPGFTSLDWDRDLASLAALLGVESACRLGTAAPGPRAGLPLPFIGQIVATTAQRGAAYEGFFRSTRPFADNPGRFLHDHCMVRKDDSGLLRLNLATGGVFVDGWVLLLQDQIFIIGAEFASAALVFALLNGVDAARVEVLDGLILSPTRDAGRTPTASAIVLQRIGELSGDAGADEARFTQLAGLEWVAPEGSVPEALRRHLTRDTGDAQLALGGDWLLRMPLARSMSRGVPAP